MLNRLLLAFAMVVALAWSNSGQAALVTFTLNINEITAGSGTFTLLAGADTGDNFGIASYGVELTGGVTAVNHNSPNAIAADFRNVGFRVIRSLDNNPILSASQDTIVPGYVAHGIGQTAGDLSTITGGVGLVIVEGNPYNAQVELASGTWSGALPGINTSGATGANVFSSAAGLATFTSAVGTAMNFTPVPEPSVMALMGLALGCVAAGRFRRRRQAS